MKRYYFECENGRRWTETDTFRDTKDGDTCNFSGCLRDHKVKLVKTVVDSDDVHGWFKGWDKWEDAPVYKNLL